MIMTAAAPESASPTTGPDSMTRQGKADYYRDLKNKESLRRHIEVQQENQERRRESQKAGGAKGMVAESGLYDPGDKQSLTDEKEIANLAVEEAKRRSKKMRTGTKTVLTSPLGAVTSANTAVTRLGGA